MIGGDFIDKIYLSQEQQKAFEKMLMIGIVKTLKEEGMLSDVQLNSAISKIEKQNTCASYEAAV